jgi:hypothetical protein
MRPNNNRLMPASAVALRQIDKSIASGTIMRSTKSNDDT